MSTPGWAVGVNTDVHIIPGGQVAAGPPLSWQQVQATTQFLLESIIGRIAIAFGGIDIFGWKPLEFLAEWGQDRIDEALENYQRAMAAQAQANTAIANAATADANAAVADGKAATAQTWVQSTVDQIWQSIFGGAQTNNPLGSIVTSLQKGWADFWDGLNGTTGSTAKLPSDVRVAGAAVRSTANTGVTNAATADAKAVTAQTNHSTLTTNLSTQPQNVLGSIANVIVDGVANVSGFLSNLWEGLTGQSGTGKTVANVKTAAASVTSTANTGVANAATADAKAVTADGKAVTADGKAVVAQSIANDVIASGPNLCPNPSFENINFASSMTNAAYSTEQARTGTRSMKLTRVSTATSSCYLFQGGTGTSQLYVPALPGDVFYIEFWIYGHASNVGSAGMCRLVLAYMTGPGTGIISYGVPQIAGSTALNGVWTKVSGYYTAPANTAYIRAYVDVLNTVPAGDIFYFDDVVIQRVTEGYVADGKAVAAQAQANTATTNAATADGKAVTADAKAVTADGKAVTAQTNHTTLTTNLSTSPQNVLGSIANVVMDGVANVSSFLNGIWDAFTGGSGASGKTIANVKTAAASVTSTANTASTTASTAVTNAATADGKAVAAQGTANTATTNLQTVVDGTVQAVDGGTATGATATTVKTKLQKAWADFWDGLNGTTGTASKLPSDVRVAGAAVRSTANTGVTNAATADAKAVTADGKAVTADGKAVTADGKAVAAQNQANTATTNAATADSKAVAAQGISSGQLVSGSNIIPNPSFEVTSFYNSDLFSSEQARSGTRSLKLTKGGGAVSYYLINDGTSAILKIPAAPGDVYSVEYQIYGHASNTAATGSPSVLVTYYDASGATITSGQIIIANTPALKGVWTKVTGTVTTPANTASISSRAYLGSTVDTGDIFYFDDIVIREITEGNVAKTNAAAAQAQANTATTNAATADAKAVTADGKAVTADGKAVVAQTNHTTLTTNLSTSPQNVIGSIVNVVMDGVSNVGSFLNNIWDAFTGGSGATGKTIANVKTAASAVTSTANTASTTASTAVTNAATADAKAVTADGKAVAAQGFAFDAIKSGASIFPDGGFENTAYAAGNGQGVYETGVKLSGSQSMSLTGPSKRINLTTGTTASTFANAPACRPSSTFYVEGWVYGDPANVGGGGLLIYFDDFDAAGVLQPHQARNISATTALSGVWTKMSGTVTLSANAARAYIFIYHGSTVPAGDKYYYDNFVGYEITEANAADVKAVAAQSTANTGVTNAATAQTTANTATTNLQTVVDGTTQAVDGGTATGAAATTVKTKLQKAWADFWDGLNGTTGTASKLPSDVRVAGAAVRSTANTGVTNAATADAKAVTADGKAVTADGKAVTADGKAVVAQSIANDVIASGPNLCPNPSFENTNFASSMTNAAYSTEQARTGTRSMKLTRVSTAASSCYLFQGGTGTSQLYVPALPGDVFYIEFWIYGHASNVGSAGMCRLVLAYMTGPGTGIISYGVPQIAGSTALNGVWTKVSGYYTAPANTAYIRAYVDVLNTVPAGDIFYFDDVVIQRVTEGYVADGKAVAAQAQANTATTNAATADGKAVTADGKAVTADGKAVTADGKAVTAQAQANTATTNAATADGKAVTADGKAVTADGKAVTADGKAVTAQAQANTATTNAATADGKAVAINQALFNQATPGSTIAQAKVANLTTDLSAVVDKVERIGSGCKISRVSTGFLTATFGRNKFPTNWFWDTKNSATADYTVEESGSPLRPTGKITVAYAGWYLVEIGFRVNQASWGTWQIAPLLYVNGSVNKVGSDASATGVTAGARFSQSSFIVYLTANQYIEPGYDAYCKDFLGNSVDIPNVFTGAAGSVDTYCSMTLLNRSYA